VIDRPRELSELRRALRANPVVVIVGARQTGKTTLARILQAGRHGPSTYFDLEDPDDLALLSEPMLALRELRGLVVIDEVQARPDLFPVLRVLADRPRKPARFLILGSASLSLLRQGAESLAGRVHYHELRGLGLDEVGSERLNRLWLRGGFPASFTQKTLVESARWRQQFVRTFLERDLPALGIGIASSTLRRFWTMLAHYHAQTWNSSELARAFGVTDKTVRGYLDLLTAALVMRQLLPWHANISKRQVKAPKVYFSDSGILHSLLGLRTMRELETHPKVGASWEGFLLAEVVRRLGAREEECFFWATHTGAELDLLISRGNRRLGFEFKRTTAPSVTRSMRSALEVLELEELVIVHAGQRSFPLADGVRAVAAGRLLEDLRPLRP